MEDLLALDGPQGRRYSYSSHEFFSFLVATWNRIHTNPHYWHGGMYYRTVRALEEGGEEREDPGMEEGMVGDDLVQ